MQFIRQGGVFQYFLESRERENPEFEDQALLAKFMEDPTGLHSRMGQMLAK